MSEKLTICKTCKFVKEIPRNPIILADSILSYLEYEENICKECGHQKDGSSIPVVHKRMQEIMRSMSMQRDSIWKFIERYYELSEEQRKNVCVNVPRFCRPDYESVGDWEADDIDEPYSWNVVMLEVQQGTEFARTLVREWYRQNKGGEK